MTPEKLEDLKKIWAYMVMKGSITTGEYNYYGGFEGPYRHQSEKMNKFRKTMISELTEHGIAWDATDVPEYRTYSEFSGTNDPSENVECLMGTLVLKNGIMHKLGARHVSSEMLDLVQKYTLPELPESNPEIKDFMNTVFKDYTHD